MNTADRLELARQALVRAERKERLAVRERVRAEREFLAIHDFFKRHPLTCGCALHRGEAAMKR